MSDYLSTLAAPRLRFPALDPVYGLAPGEKNVIPAAVLERPGEAMTWPLSIEGPLTLDFGRKLAGRVHLECDGPLEYACASDLDQLELLLDLRASGASLDYDLHQVYIHQRPLGRIEPDAGGRATRLEEGLSVFRLLRLQPAAGRPVRLHRCWLEFAPPHAPLDGGFLCNDEEVNLIWQMGAYTTLLCTQNNMDSLDGVPAPGSGYVIWDGPRRDREVWAGDLRPASLAWMSAWADPEPVRNSLYMLWHARHVGCAEHGLIPGSASSHQTFYEWTFWFLVNAWEYYLWSGDRHFLKCLLWRGGLEQTLAWIKSRLNPHGLVEATNSWMWTFKISGEMAALAIVQVAGLEALARLFEAGGQTALAAEARRLAEATRAVIPGKFFDAEWRALRMQPAASGRRPRVPLDANAWAVLYGIGDEAQQQACLEALEAEPFKTEAGLQCLWPLFDERDGDWFANPATCWMHNGTVWPYPNAYAAWAQFAAGRTARALETLKAFHRPHIRQGHATLWEVMMPDGSNPVKTRGNLGSLCHAWGATGTYLLQRYVLGIEPVSPGYLVARCRPDLGALAWASGIVPTPHGPIRVTLERSGNGVRGELIKPQAIELAEAPAGLTVRSA